MMVMCTCVSYEDGDEGIDLASLSELEQQELVY